MKGLRPSLYFFSPHYLKHFNYLHFRITFSNMPSKLHQLHWFHREPNEAQALCIVACFQQRTGSTGTILQTIFLPQRKSTAGFLNSSLVPLCCQIRDQGYGPQVLHLQQSLFKDCMPALPRRESLPHSI